MYKLLPILLFAYGLAITTDEIYDNSWAVIIGINEYEYVDKLNYAVQDAETIKDLLISNFNFPKENIIMLTDGDATLTNIRTKLFEVATSVNKRDRLLVYYAGQGINNMDVECLISYFTNGSSVCEIPVYANNPCKGKHIGEECCISE